MLLIIARFTAPQFALALGTPALAISALAVIGHTVTLDEDLPGDWSNTERSASIWRWSVAELGLKIAVLGAIAWLMFG